VEVAGVACDSRHPVLNVFQHQVVLWLAHSQSGVHVAKNQIIAQRVLLFVGGVFGLSPVTDLRGRWSMRKAPASQ
jgi:hypothetical protein